jgi:UDP-2,3-diacylglucosamine hydrolase
MKIMDVQPQAIERVLGEAGCTQMIHGHTHRPALHEMSVAGHPARRYVLPDWDFDQADPARGGWIEVDARGIRPVARVPLQGPQD